MGRVVILVLMLASLGLAVQASRDLLSLTTQARKLNGYRVIGRCEPGSCDPSSYPCVYWENPCPNLLPLLPQWTVCGTCVDENYDVLLMDPCPTTACASTQATAVSQNGGCAKATTMALASSGGQTVWDNAIAESKIYIEGFLSGSMQLNASAYGFAMAMGEACSFAMTKYFQSACFCCNDIEFFKGSAAANASAVAQVVAQSAVKAFAIVNATYPTFYSEVTQYIGAGADANAFAADLRQVMASVTASFIGTTSGVDVTGDYWPVYFPSFKRTQNCWAITYGDCKNAVAKALSCTVVSAFSKIYLDPVYMNETGGTENWASTCSKSQAISGPSNEFSQTCDIDCPCGTYTDTQWDPIMGKGICKTGASCSNVTATSFGCTCKDSTKTYCDGCVDTKKDVANCGACGKKCGYNQYCKAGVCTCNSNMMGVPMTFCNAPTPGACCDTQNDVTNCGSCGVKCTVTGHTCIRGSCACGATDYKQCGTKCAYMGDNTSCGSCTTVCSGTKSCRKLFGVFRCA